MSSSKDTDRLYLVTHTQNNERTLFPKDFIDAIRTSVEAGFSSEQIVSILLLSASVLSVKDVDGDDLIGRTKEVSTVLGGLNRRKK